jgi:hypothetical protein
MARTCAFHKVWLPRTNLSETDIRLMAVMDVLEAAIAREPGI